MRACLGIQRWVEGQPIPLTACLQGGDARIPDSATASHAMTVWHACRRRCAVALPDAAAAGGVAGGAHAAPAHPGCARRPGAPTLAPALTGCLVSSIGIHPRQHVQHRCWPLRGGKASDTTGHARPLHCGGLARMFHLCTNASKWAPPPCTPGRNSSPLCRAQRHCCHMGTRTQHLIHIRTNRQREYLIH